MQVRWDCEVCPHYFCAELCEALGWGRLRVSCQDADAVRVGVLEQKLRDRAACEFLSSVSAQARDCETCGEAHLGCLWRRRRR